jgi:predicted ATP-grasp superfamily ATP-dependent carboligase
MMAKLQNKVGAVITGGEFLGLGVLRTLGKKGIPTILLDHEQSISKYSRFNIKHFKSPRPSEMEEYVNFLIQLVKREGIQGWIIFPTDDQTVYLLSRYKEILKNYYRIPTPGWEVIRNVYIKKETYRVAERNGILIPKLYDINSFEQLVGADLQYPLVIKPSISHRFYSKTRTKAIRINNKEELIKAYKRVSDIIDPAEILVQDLIPGGPKNLYSFCPFFKNGKVITGIAGRRARQRPMDFGQASTYVELVDIPELRSISERFLGLINYYGIAEVEFMYDPRDHRYKLLEVNPRVWAWHSLAMAAGVDLPYLLYQDMAGEKVEVPTSIRQVKWIRLITDIPTAFSEIVKGNLKINDYLVSMKGKKEDAVLSLTDPLPFLVEIPQALYRKIKRGL